MPTGDSKLIEITDANFAQKVLKSANPFLLDISGEWCQPCKAIAPLIEELATKYTGKVDFGTIDINRSPVIPTQYRVQSIPTLLMFSGGKVIGQLTGAHPKARIEDLIKKAL